MGKYLETFVCLQVTWELLGSSEETLTPHAGSDSGVDNWFK